MMHPARRPPTPLQRLLGLVLAVVMAAAPIVHSAGVCHPGSSGDPMVGSDTAAHHHHNAAPTPADVPDLDRDCCGLAASTLVFLPATVTAVVVPSPEAAAWVTPDAAAIPGIRHHPPSTGPPPALLRS